MPIAPLTTFFSIGNFIKANKMTDKEIDVLISRFQKRIKELEAIVASAKTSKEDKIN